MKSHSIADCNMFLPKSNKEKLETVRENGACWNCLSIGHKGNNCPHKKRCEIEGCQSYHHPIVHPAHVEGLIFHSENEYEAERNPCLLLIMPLHAENSLNNIPTNVNTMWDSAATISLIRNEMAKS